MPHDGEVNQEIRAFRAETHIENRRLFNLAAGILRLDTWEEEHLHGCKVCQGVLFVFLAQPASTSIEDPSNPADAA